MTPTIERLMKCYARIALVERMKSGRPGERTVQNALRSVCRVCRAAGIPLTDSISRLTRQAIDTALVTFLREGVTRHSAWGYVCQTRSLFARWCRPYYEDAGWTVGLFEAPVFRIRPPRYERPSEDILKRVRAWYMQLEGELWFAATMMLEFAVRNGDVMRLNDSNFVQGGDGISLVYTPHKTALTSGRRVVWPVHRDIWGKFDEMGGFRGLDLTDEIFVDMNRQLRSLGFRGPKASYELRKICIDHIYQKFGAEMATSISGDDIKTIVHYYADPSQPNIGAVRIVDLL